MDNITNTINNSNEIILFFIYNSFYTYSYCNTFLIYNNTYGNPHNHNNENHHPMTNRAKYNIFLFISTFARNLVEVFISLILFKNGFPLISILQFYLLGTLFSIPVSYFFVRIGERFNYSIIMCVGIVAFVALQLALNAVTESTFFIISTALLYSLYKRGYWVARRYYVAEVIPQKNSTKPFSIMMVISEIASILAGFLGGSLLDGLNASILTIISSVLLLISIIPLLRIQNKTKKTKIELIKNLKKKRQKKHSGLFIV
ncbi:MFS transporter [Candidatus Saccharibacteria bacterium]|nr:MFS transporter [Candidatus Saccharibacteria bacterium]